MKFNIDDTWRNVLRDQFSSAWYEKLERFLEDEYERGEVYPPAESVFEAFNRTPFDSVRAVMIGQDPYPNPGQAHGLCFSVPDGVPLPRSLRNVYRELEAECRAPFMDRSGNLAHWAEQGVLMLNATLTVAAGKAGSHQGRGWETFTDAVVRLVAERREHVVFFLWGAYAQRKGKMIDRTRHLVLEAAHPSPLSARRGFFGCNHFLKANEYLRLNGIPEIEW